MYKRLTTLNKPGVYNVECSDCPIEDRESCTFVDCFFVVCKRLGELEDMIENRTLVELEKPYIRQVNSIPQQYNYIICKAQEVGISGVLTKAETEKKLRELKENNND